LRVDGEVKLSPSGPVITYRGDFDGVLYFRYGADSGDESIYFLFKREGSNKARTVVADVVEP
jgi:hypothetical protein